MEDILKTCKRCGETKPLEMFHKAKANKDGHNCVCGVCKNKESSEYSKTYRKTKRGKEVSARASKKYNQKHPDKARKQRAKDVWKVYVKEYRKGDHYKKQQREYREKNREKKREQNRIWMREYRKIPQNKIKSILRNRINDALRTQNATKCFKTMDMLGCSIEFFKAHIESKFTLGMAWDNHGRGSTKWHIDHIIPCDFFDLTNPEEQKKCFHWTNLQPLWEPDNLSKGNKLIAA